MYIKAGVDLGTSSIGFMVWGIDDGIYEPLYHEIRLFKEPVDSGKTGLTLKSAQRRTARQARRQQKRYARRMKGLKVLGLHFGLTNDEIHADRSLHLTELRSLAATSKIELKDFFHVLVRLAKRRGYKGEFKHKANAETEKDNALSKEKDNEEGAVEKGSLLLREKMTLLASELKMESVTLGQFLYAEYQKGNSIYLKANLDVKHSFDDLLHISEHSDHSFRDYTIADFAIIRSLISGFSSHF